jgi:hypothetical protein
MQARGSRGYAYYDEDDEDKAAIEFIKLGKEGARCPSHVNKKERQKRPQRPGMSAGCAGTRRKNERGEMATQSGRVELERILRRREGAGSKMEDAEQHPRL